MRKQFEKIQNEVINVLTNVEDTMGMNLSYSQERMLFQVKYKLMECKMYLEDIYSNELKKPYVDPNQTEFAFESTKACITTTDAPVSIGTPAYQLEYSNTPVIVTSVLKATRKKATRKKAEPKVEKVILSRNPNVIGLVVEDTKEVSPTEHYGIKETSMTYGSRTQFTLSVDSDPVVEVIQQHNTAQESLAAQPPIAPAVKASAPSIDDIRMAFRNYCQANGVKRGAEVLAMYEVNNLSELYEKGTQTVLAFYASII